MGVAYGSDPINFLFFVVDDYFANSGITVISNATVSAFRFKWKKGKNDYG